MHLHVLQIITTAIWLPYDDFSTYSFFIFPLPPLSGGCKAGVTLLRQGMASAALHLSIASRALATPVLTLFWTPPVLDSGSCKHCDISDLRMDGGELTSDCKEKLREGGGCYGGQEMCRVAP